MRKIAASLTLFTVFAFSGCGSSETTDPKTLKPLTAADIAEIKARDTQVEDEEGAMRVEAPKTTSKTKSRSRAAGDGLGER